MNKNVVVIGASGHGKVIADIARQSGDYVLGFLDDNTDLPESIAGIPVLGCICDYKTYEDAYFIIAIGNSVVREQIANAMQKMKWYTAIHPTAVISSVETQIGEGSVIAANAVVNSCATIGKHCIVNTSAVIEHDNQIGDYVHVSVGAKLAGTVVIGEHSWIGIGAIVSNNLMICSHCTIGAGAVVVRSITESGTYVGIPARKMNEDSGFSK